MLEEDNVTTGKWAIEEGNEPTNKLTKNCLSSEVVLIRNWYLLVFQRKVIPCFFPESPWSSQSYSLIDDRGRRPLFNLPSHDGHVEDSIDWAGFCCKLWHIWSGQAGGGWGLYEETQGIDIAIKTDTFIFCLNNCCNIRGVGRSWTHSGCIFKLTRIFTVYFQRDSLGLNYLLRVCSFVTQLIAAAAGFVARLTKAQAANAINLNGGGGEGGWRCKY